MSSQDPNYQDPYNPQAGNPHGQPSWQPQQYPGQPPYQQDPYHQQQQPQQYPGQPPYQGYPTYLGAPQHPQRSGGKRRTIIVSSIAAVVVLALLGGIGAWAATRLWYASGDQPETAMPASVSAYGRLDLSPSLDQTVKLFNVLRKFPSVDARGDSIPEMEKNVFADLGLDGMNYDTDIKPWFGHKIGIGTWSDSRSALFALVAMSSTDDDQATAALKKAVEKQPAGEVGFSVKDGWALVALGENDAPAAVKAASAEASKSSLADLGDFSTALGNMPDGQIAIGWADLQLLKKHLKSAGGSTELFSGLSTNDIPDTLTGHVMMAARAASSGIELRIRIGGLKELPPLGDNVLPALGKMPRETAVGIACGMSADAGKATQSYVDSLTKLLGDSSLDPAEVSDFIKGILTAKLLSVSVLGISGDTPAMRLTTEARSATSASAIAKILTELASSLSANVNTSGTTVDLTTKGYAPGSGILADQSLYKTAMADMPAKSTVAAYVDLSALFGAADVDAKTRSELAPLKAVGLGAGIADNEVSVLLRAVTQ